MITYCNFLGQESYEEIINKVKEGIEGLKNQPETTEKYSNMDKGPATYSVVKKLRDNDMELHTDKQVILCTLYRAVLELQYMLEKTKLREMLLFQMRTI